MTNEPTTSAERIKVAITDEVAEMFRNKNISETRHDGSEEAVKACKAAGVAAEESLQLIITNLLIDFNRIARSLEALANVHGAHTE